MRFVHSLHLAVMLFCAPFAFAQPKASTPEESLQLFKAAVDAGDLKAAGNLIAEDAGARLRKLAGPFAKAKAASDRLDKAIEAKSIQFKNVFAAGLAPFADMQFEVVELARENNQLLARVKCGPRGKAMEETVSMKSEDNQWRLAAPAELARAIPAKDRVDSRAKGLDALADTLNAVAAEVESGKLKTKEDLAIRMIQAVDASKLADSLL